MITPEKSVGRVDGSLSDDIPKTAVIHEAFSMTPEFLRGRLINRNHGRTARTIIKLILKIYSVIYYRIYIVDWNDGWIPFGILRALKIARREKTDLIFTDMEPPSSSLIGLCLKQITGLPLVVDYHDPWTTSVYSERKGGIRKKLAEYLERQVLLKADAVTAGKENIISGIIRKFSQVDPGKCRTIFSGFDPDDYKGIIRKKGRRFTITYTGKLSEKFYYSPESFLHALSELIHEGRVPREDVRAVFVGSVSPGYRGRYERLIRKLDLEKVVMNTGTVDHRACAEYQMNSDLLLYIIEALENRTLSEEFAGVLPSKLYEYMYTGNPILAVVPRGFESELIGKTKTGRVAEPNNVESVKTVLLKYYLEYKNETLNEVPDQAEVQKFNREFLTGELAGIFDRVASRSEQQPPIN